MSKRMPVLFIGHGSPMNAIEDNKYVREWKNIADRIEKPRAILSVSAHWVTSGTRINDSEKPKMIYDMFGFPKELYQLVYDVPGSSEFAHETMKLIGEDIKIDNSWGVDHGTWSVLCKMFSKADIPVFQLGLDFNASAETHYQIGQKISALREQGVLIIGSGNVVHNLSKLNWEMENGYPWAEEFDNYILENITKKQYGNVVNYKKAGKSAELAFYSTEHFYPLLYVLGASRTEDKLTIFNHSCLMGSMSMTCYFLE